MIATVRICANVRLGDLMFVHVRAYGRNLNQYVVRSPQLMDGTLCIKPHAQRGDNKEKTDDQSHSGLPALRLVKHCILVHSLILPFGLVFGFSDALIPRQGSKIKRYG